MKFYSEKLNAIFDTEEDLLKAETKHESERAATIIAVKNAEKSLNKCMKAIEDFYEALTKLCDIDEEAAAEFSINSLPKITKAFSHMLF